MQMAKANNKQQTDIRNSQGLRETNAEIHSFLRKSRLAGSGGDKNPIMVYFGA